MKKMFCLWAIILCGQLELWSQQTLVFGASSNQPGATLVFVNAGDYPVESGYCFPTVSGSYMDYNLGSDPESYPYPYVGYYYNCLQNFLALPATDGDGNPLSGASAPGTVIQLKLLRAEGPAGARLAYWRANNDGSYSTNLTWSVPVPLASGTNFIRITEADNSPANDPYGQIQHQVFGFTQPGLYKLTWQLVDTSTNGVNGAPLNQPSAPFATYYQADCTIAGITCDATGVHLRFVAPNGALQPDNTGFSHLQYNILKSSTLGPNATWSTVLDSEGHYIIIDGDDYIHTNTLPLTGNVQFYKLFSYIPSSGT